MQIRKEKNGVNHVQDPKVDKEKVADLSGIQAVKRENTEATDLKKVVVQDTSIEKEAGIYTNKVETDSETTTEAKTEVAAEIETKEDAPINMRKLI